MPNISNASDKVPMLFRAQVDGRCQLQRLQKDEDPHVIRWAEEWTERTYPDAPQFSNDVQSRTYQINWRFLSNGGQDDSIIRPAIGARGWPFVPGSSMKGLFRRACISNDEKIRYCGSESEAKELKPGLLRFHGGYPTDTSWTEDLVDIVHPQQDWQVKSDRKSGGAFALISLHEPEFRFGISSIELLDDTEWETIWAIWERALARGIGGRVSAGYGQPQDHKDDELYYCQLKGQGQAPKLFDGTGEFRPNIFRAGIRGHALRIFGGLTNEKTAEQAVEELFGGVKGGATVGLLSMAFRPSQVDISSFGQESYEQPTYSVKGELSWSLTRSLDDEHRDALTQLIEALTRFAMVLGGFGKSWRRADHRLFMPEYYDQGYKPLIGCHWKWSGKRSLVRDVRVRKLEKTGEFINSVRQAARSWLELKEYELAQGDRFARWREAWHPNNVQVWGRPHLDANRQPLTAEQCEAIRWFHGPYRAAFPEARLPEGSIYQSSITGFVRERDAKVGQVWHRMYPFINLKRDSETGKREPRQTPAFFEFLTIFPNGSPESDEFLYFLEDEQQQFQKLWPL